MMFPDAFYIVRIKELEAEVERLKEAKNE